MIKNGMNILSLFDGLSGGQIALDQLGIKVNNYYASEIDKYAIQVAKHNYPNTKHLGSVLDLTREYLESLHVDMLIGGFPCQSYSVSGKREGLNSKNGQLIYEVFRILRIVQPEIIMLENVKGLVSIDKGETFRHILEELNNCNYAVDIININSALVSAQNRERIYIIGKRLDKCHGNIYDLDYSKENINATLKKSRCVI